MGLDKKELKKIEKEKKIIGWYLSDIEKYKDELENLEDNKKTEKLNKKIKDAQSIILSAFKKIGMLDGKTDEIINNLSDRQMDILLEIFPYGLNSDSLDTQKRRNEIVDKYKGWIKKLKKLREEYPPYDASLPVRQKLKNKIYKQEKDIGWFMLGSSNPDWKTYDPEWNYKEHFATSTEFTQEERDIIEHCIKIGEEYDKYLDERYGFLAEIGESLCGKGEAIKEWGNEKQAKIWAENLYTKIFPDVVKNMNPHEKMSAKELEAEAKAMSKRFVKFIGDREELERCLFLWNELKKDEKLNGYREDKKNVLVFSSLLGELGEEKAWFAYAYTQLPETKDGIELLLNYSFEELGLE